MPTALGWYSRAVRHLLCLAFCLLVSGACDGESGAGAPTVGGDCGYRPLVGGEITITRVSEPDAAGQVRVSYRFDVEGRPYADVASVLYDGERTTEPLCGECLERLGLAVGATLPASPVQVSTLPGGCAPFVGRPFPPERCACPPGAALID